MNGATPPTTIARRAGGRLMACGLLVCALLPPSAQGQEYAKARYEGAEQLVPELEKLAVWCASVGLHRERDRTYANILELKSDHALARKALLYQRQPDGSWVQSSSYREPKDASEKQLPTYREKCATISRPFVTRVFEALEKDKDTTPPKTRASRLRELLWFDPDHAGVRTALGEAKRDADWVLVETVTGARRRAEIEKMAKACVDAPLKLEPAETTPFEDALGIPWIFKKKTAHVRVIATVPEKEADKTLKISDAAYRFTLQALQVEGAPWKDLTMVVCDKPEQGLAFLRASPNLGEEDRKALATFHSYWLFESGHFVSFEAISAERFREAVCRTIGTTLTMTTDLYETRGGPYEGLVVYLTYRLTGIRKPFFGKAVAGEEALEETLPNPKADWLKGAAKLAEAGKAVSIKDLLTVDAFRLNLSQSLFAYAFTAFLVEGCPEQASKFLRVVGRLTPDDAANEVFGVDLAVLEPRFHRWLREYR